MSDLQKIIIAIAGEISENGPVVVNELERLASAMNGLPECYHKDMLKSAFVKEEQGEP